MSLANEGFKPIYVALGNGFVDQRDGRSIGKLITDKKYPDFQLELNLMRPDRDGLAVLSTGLKSTDGMIVSSGIPRILMGFVVNQLGVLESIPKFREGHISVFISRDPLRVADPFYKVIYQKPPGGDLDPKSALAVGIEVLGYKEPAAPIRSLSLVARQFRFINEEEREFTRSLAAAGLPDRVNLVETLMEYCRGRVSIDSILKSPVVAA